MYEEIQVKRRIDWKSAFTKLAIFCLLVFILGFLIFHPKNVTYAETDYEHNLKQFVAASKSYFKNGNLPTNVGNESIVKLSTLINEKKLKHIDLESDKCNKEQSFAKITKISKKEYSLYVYLECESNQKSSVDTIDK